MKKVLIVCFIVLLSFIFNKNSYAVNFGDGYHSLDGLYTHIYLMQISGDDKTDNNGRKIADNIGFNMNTLVLRPLYYSGNFLAGALIPLGNVEMDIYSESDSGLGDIMFGVGYFLPVDWANILPVVQVKIPTGPFDKNKFVNYGSGQWDLWLETYFNKFSRKFSYDAAIKYWIRFENDEINFKPGNELRLEGLATYSITNRLRLGPSISYLIGEDNELNGSNIDKSGIKKLSLGAEIVYHYSPDVLFAFTVMDDIDTENALETSLFMLRVTFSH